jgi:putative transposase
VKRHQLRCVAYCLMLNHYHLVLETRDGQLSRAIQALNGRYANRFNHRYARDAHLFKNRFGATSQRTQSQLLWTLRYTVMNPVESGLCGSPDEWRWSSYRASAGIDPVPSFLDVDHLWSLFGDTAGTAMARYRDLVDGIVGV